MGDPETAGACENAGQDSMNAVRRSRWRTVLKCVAFLAAIGVLAVVMFYSIRAGRRAARRAARINNLRPIAMGLLNHQSAMNRLPPAVLRDEMGRPLSSWRFQLVPFLEAIMMAYDHDDRWDAPVNRWLYTSWSDYYGWPPKKHLAAATTNVVAITGPGTAFEEGKVVRLPELDRDTILAIEIAETDILWMEPGDISIDEVPESLVRGIEGDGVTVVFADGNVWFLRADVPLADLKKFFTIDGAKKHNREALLGPYRVGQ
jgi:hypothetical protein